MLYGELSADVPQFQASPPGAVDLPASQRAILESPLFYICLEDNEWSLAVELIQKEPPWCQSYAGLQSRHYQAYLKGIEKCLLDRLPSIGTYKSAWTSGRLTRAERSA